VRGVELIEGIFSKLRSQGKTAFIPYICAGDPDLETSYEIALALERAGSDMIELGIPFSDPIADGPTIQRATMRALESGTTPPKVLKLVERLRRRTDMPIFLMTYFNLPFRYGLKEFCRDASAAGVDGLIIPDLPPEEGDEYAGMAREAGLATVFLAAPTSSIERLRLIASMSTGFIYCVSVTGVTGERERLSAEVESMTAKLRRVTDKPIGVGFGISKPEHVREVGRLADAAIVGSAIIRRMEEAMGEGRNPVEEVERFASQLARAAHSRGSRGEA